MKSDSDGSSIPLRYIQRQVSIASNHHHASAGTHT